MAKEKERKWASPRPRTSKDTVREREGHVHAWPPAAGGSPWSGCRGLPPVRLRAEAHGAAKPSHRPARFPARAARDLSVSVPGEASPQRLPCEPHERRSPGLQGACPCGGLWGPVSQTRLWPQHEWCLAHWRGPGPNAPVFKAPLGPSAGGLGVPWSRKGHCSS